MLYTFSYDLEHAQKERKERKIKKSLVNFMCSGNSDSWLIQLITCTGTDPVHATEVEEREIEYGKIRCY